MSSLTVVDDSYAPPNGGYGWAVVCGSFLVQFLVLGNIYSFGILYPILIRDFESNYGTVAWIGSLAFGLMAGLASFSGAFADRYGNRQVVFIGGLVVSFSYLFAALSNELWALFVTLGFMAGVGYSMAFVAGIAVVSQWFSTRRGLAVGIAMAGSGAGQFSLSLTTNALIQAFGWRDALKILFIISLVGFSISALLIRRFLPCFHLESNESFVEFFYDRDFALLYIGVFFGSLGTNMQYVHVASYALLHGLSSSEVAYLVAAMGIASFIGRVVNGYLADSFGKILMFQICYACAGIVTFSWLACSTFPSLLAFVSFFGYFGGGLISLIPSVSSVLFGLEKQGVVLGLLLTGTAVGNLLSSPIAGFLYDASGDYFFSIVVAGGLTIVGTVFILFVRKQDSNEARGEQACSP